jgi:hypothetical protein
MRLLYTTRRSHFVPNYFDVVSFSNFSACSRVLSVPVIWYRYWYTLSSTQTDIRKIFRLLRVLTFTLYTTHSF